MMTTLHMTVNGNPETVAVEEGEALLDTLRERLGLSDPVLAFDAAGEAQVAVHPGPLRLLP